MAIAALEWLVIKARTVSIGRINGHREEKQMKGWKKSLHT
jgi:hypothetical protein